MLLEGFPLFGGDMKRGSTAKHFILGVEDARPNARPFMQSPNASGGVTLLSIGSKKYAYSHL